MLSFLYSPVSHPYMTTGKTTALTRRTFVSKVMFLLFNMLSRLAVAFLLRGKLLLISWLQSLSTVILETKKIKSLLPLFPLLFSMKIRCYVFHPWMLSFKLAFLFSSFTLIKRLFSSSSLSARRVVSSAYLRLLIVHRQSWFQLVIHPDCISHDVLCI